MNKFVIEDEEGKQTIVPLIRDEITIGRLEGNTIRLTERNVSRRHARLLKQNGQLFFENVSARYGSKVNGENVTNRVPVRDGDVFVVGDYRMYLQGTQPGVMPSPHGPGMPADMSQPPPVYSGPMAQPQMMHPGPPPPGPGPMPKPSSDATAVITFTPPVPAAPAPAIPAAECNKLVVLTTKFAGTEFPLSRDDYVIGRTPDNDIALDHRSISRRHARVTNNSGVVRISDLGSANGIRINGDPYQAVELRRGDTIELGHVKFRFVAAGEPFVYDPSMAEEGVKSSRGIGKIILIAALILALVAGAGAYVIFFMPKETDSSGQVSSGTSAADTGSVRDASSTAVLTGGALLVSQAEELMNSAQWEEAIALLEQVSQGDEHYREADQRLVRARSELNNQAKYEDILAAIEASNYQTALSLVTEIRDDSHYHTRIIDEGITARIRTGMLNSHVNSAQQLIEAGSLQQARTDLTAVSNLFGDEPRFAQTLASLEAAEELAREQRERDREQRERDREQRDRQRQEAAATAAAAAAADSSSSSSGRDRDRGRTTTLSRAERDERVRELIRDAGRVGLQGNRQEAINLLNEARELDPNNARIYMALYRNYDGLGNRRQAARALRRYIELSPNDPNIEEHRQTLQQLE